MYALGFHTKNQQKIDMQLSPYLHFDGRCEAAFHFYEECLGGKILTMITYEGTPMEAEVPAEWRKKILHAGIALGGMRLFGSDHTQADYKKPAGCSISLEIGDPADAERVFKALAEHGTIHMPLQETFWAQRFGTLDDQFGVPWMINCEKSTESAG